MYFRFRVEAQAKTLQSKLYLRFTHYSLVPSAAAFQQILNKEYKPIFISIKLFSFEAEQSVSILNTVLKDKDNCTCSANVISKYPFSKTLVFFGN